MRTIRSIRISSDGHRMEAPYDDLLKSQNGRQAGHWVYWDWDGGQKGLTVAGIRRERMILIEKDLFGQDFTDRVVDNPTVMCPNRGDIFACPVIGIPTTGQFGRYVRVNPDGSGRLYKMDAEPRWKAVGVIVGDGNATVVDVSQYPGQSAYFQIQIL